MTDRDEIDRFVEEAKILIQGIRQIGDEYSNEWLFAEDLSDLVAMWEAWKKPPGRGYYFWEKGEQERTVSACSNNCDLPIGHDGEHKKIWKDEG